MAMQTAPNGKVDRQTTVPFHLKLFYRTGSFHNLTDFPTSTPTPLPPHHLQIYTWPTCTLRELSHLLLSALPSLLPSPPTPGTRLSYRLVYPDTHAPPSLPGRYLSKELGYVMIGGGDGDGEGRLPGEEEAKLVRGGVMAGRLEGEPEKSLQEARFVVGDFVCCAVLAPGEGGAVMGAGRGGARGRGFGGGWENGGGGGGGGGGYRGRGGGGMRGGGGTGGFNGARVGDGGVPSGEWRRGERVPEGRGGFVRGRGRAY